MPFVDDIPGIRDLQNGDGPLLPRRSRLSLLGGVTVADNPTLGSTDVTFIGPPTAAPETIQLLVGMTLIPVYTQAGLLRVTYANANNMHGMTKTANPVVVLVNVTTTRTITLYHESATAADPEMRFVCPGAVNYVLGGGNSVQIVRDTVSLRWRVVS